jgi:hypothetical protein
MIRKTFIVCVVAILTGAILTHYMEAVQLPLAIEIRELVKEPPPWRGLDENIRSRGSEDTGFRSVDIAHPVRAALSVREEVDCVLSLHLEAPPVSVFPRRRLPPGAPCDGGRLDRQRILRIADWFLETGEELSYEGTKALMIPFRFPEETYSLDPPWYSGMAQGMAGEVLLAAYFISKEEKYFEGMILAANGLRIPIRAGGTAVVLEHGVWFEEYASSRVADRSPLVLNGHMFAMDLLFWLKQIRPADWTTLYAAGHEAVEATISRYLSVGWSYYDRHENFANAGYHRLHARQLRRLAKVGLPARNIETAIEAMDRGLLYPVGIFERLWHQHNNMILFLWAVNSVFALLLFLACRRVVLFFKRDRAAI